MGKELVRVEERFKNQTRMKQEQKKEHNNLITPFTPPPWSLGFSLSLIQCFGIVLR